MRCDRLSPSASSITSAVTSDVATDRFRLVSVARYTSVVNGTCVVRYDNESGKGDHRHFNTRERPYTFETPEQLIADFQADMARWNRENRHS